MDLNVARRRIEERWREVGDRVAAACQRSGRDHGDVTVVAVTKTVSAEVAALLPDLGIMDLGESRPQELWRKADALPATVRWHLIGHLQRNKVEATVAWRPTIHSVDSLRLLDALDEAVGSQESPVRVFLEVNASGEAQKHGFRPDDLASVRDHLAKSTSGRVVVSGLMTMAALDDDPESAHSTFRLLRQLRDRLADLPSPHRLQHLSMGMSQDFEVAIEEGATYLRLGSVLFEGLDE